MFFLIFDALIIVFSFFMSFYLRFGFMFPEKYNKFLLPWNIGIIIITIALLYLFDIYDINWGFVGIFELKNMIKAMIITASLLYFSNIIIQLVLNEYSLPKGVVLIELILSFSLIAILRISKRLYYIFFRGIEGSPTMVIGVDYSGERLLKELINETDDALAPKVIIDKDKTRNKTKIHSIPVVAGFENIRDYIDLYKIKTVLLNLNHSSKKEIKNVFEIVQSAGVKDIRLVPSVKNYDSNIFKIKNFKKLSISDLLFREPVKIEYEKVENFLYKKTILVTGAAGSIGSEILRQLSSFDVKKIIAFEIDETEIFELKNEFSLSIPKEKNNIVFVLGDIRDHSKLERVFDEHRPDIVFHASAYKHVPILEEFPEEGIKTNIIGTNNLVNCVIKYNCSKLINISTDKAVNPSSVMGATKRIAEMIGKTYNSNNSKIISVRFGNVLGSRGSVIPLFLKQIENGGPITLTHKDMKRYFMSIPEAVLLVFQASYMGSGGEVFVLDMDKPIKILDLAEALIKLNNMELGKDIEIVFTGVRPGEKLFEELLTAEEGTNETDHKKIFIAKSKFKLSKMDLNKIIDNLKNNLDDKNKLFELIREIVPSNTFADNLFESKDGVGKK